MKVYLMMAEHPVVPGIVTKICATYPVALKEALECANTILADNEMEAVSDENSMNAAIEHLQDTHGAAHCYVDITEHDLIS